MLKHLKKLIKSGRLRTNQSGQATTEYILIIAFSVSFAALLFKTFLKPQFDNLKRTLALKVSNSFKGDLHQLPPGLIPKKK